MLDDTTPPTLEQQYRGSFQELADARRVLKVTKELASLPALPADERLELERIRARAIRCIEAATAELLDTLDLTLGDTDREDDDPAEHDGTDEGDLAWQEWHGRGKCKEAHLNGFGHVASEDAEDDTEDCEGTSENEPLFDKVQCRTLNALFGDGPGGGSILDSDREDGEV